MKMMDTIRATGLKMLHATGKKIFSRRTLELITFDIKRLIARRKNRGKKNLTPPHNQLHLGCGWRHVPGWLNIDVRHSEHDVDLAGGHLPWKANVFESVVSQHVIEHLELMSELLPLLREVNRVMTPGGEIWLSCPGIEQLIESYRNQQMTDLLEDRVARIPSYELGPMPTNHLLNDIFYAKGEHQNLFDLTLLTWTLEQAGFTQVKHIIEADLLSRFPAFPPRNDDKQSLYVKAIKPLT